MRSRDSFSSRNDRLNLRSHRAAHPASTRKKTYSRPGPGGPFDWQVRPLHLEADVPNDGCAKSVVRTGMAATRVMTRNGRVQRRVTHPTKLHRAWEPSPRFLDDRLAKRLQARGLFWEGRGSSPVALNYGSIHRPPLFDLRDGFDAGSNGGSAAHRYRCARDHPISREGLAGVARLSLSRYAARVQIWYAKNHTPLLAYLNAGVP